MKKDSYLLSVILPTYNEAGNIVLLVEEISRSLHKIKHQIIIVDDDSPDGTGKIVQKKYKAQQNIKSVIRKKDKGLAFSIKDGIKIARGEAIAVMDTDFNHHPKELVKMFNSINNCDLVVGSRYVAGGGMENRWRYYFSLIYNRLIKFILLLPTYDSLSGFFVIKASSLKRLPTNKIFYGYGDYFMRLLFYCAKKGLRIKEVPVFYQNRFAGESKSRFISMFVDYSKTVVELLHSE